MSQGKHAEARELMYNGALLFFSYNQVHKTMNVAGALFHTGTFENNRKYHLNFSLLPFYIIYFNKTLFVCKVMSEKCISALSAEHKHVEFDKYWHSFVSYMASRFV